ncbi:MAG: terminase small subunit [Clostridiales bacterium]|nr:terminase small subunit [Clostridiales bacterium]
MYVWKALFKNKKDVMTISEPTNGKLSEKEILFCSLYVSCGDAVSAAYKAGYKRNTEIAAQKLLNNESIVEMIQKISETRIKTAKARAMCGLERLAFGSISDGVRLIFSGEPSELKLEEMRLENISEIKRLKDGSLELKFADRIKALEKLEQLSKGDSDDALPFYRALERSSAALNRHYGDEL